MSVAGTSSTTAKRLLCALHLLVAFGAIGGGLAGMLNPQAPLGMSVEYLKDSPFQNYFIPALILFTVIGLGNLFACMLRSQSRYQGHISGFFGLALVIFIIVQCIMLNMIYFLHGIFLVIGLVQVGLAMRLKV